MCIIICCKYLLVFSANCFCTICLPIFRLFMSDCNQSRNLRCISFICGFSLGQAYYYYLLKKIAFPYYIGTILSLGISVLLGIGNAISIQIRCICLLILPMYCGKAGRGVLKAIILTYVIAGPITNMGLNAKEVVRVFACTSQLSYNLSTQKLQTISGPFRKTALSLSGELNRLKDAVSSVGDISIAIEREIVDTEETVEKQKMSDRIVKNMSRRGRQDKQIKPNIKNESYQTLYQYKLHVRCRYQLARAIAVCHEAFASIYDECMRSLPENMASICGSLRLDKACDFRHKIDGICYKNEQLNQGIDTAYIALVRAKHQIIDNLVNMKLQYKIDKDQKLYDIQDATETGERVKHAFEEKHVIMDLVINILNICMALLFLRVVAAAIAYHDMYLTNIEFDNVYVTGYFKMLDDKRRVMNELTLLPLKKMERSKYVDIHSFSYKATEQSKLLTRMLKVMLEVVTATTFVMLDRLFYEALYVVRQHALTDAQDGLQELKIDVQGIGVLSTMMKKLLASLSSARSFNKSATNTLCLPEPRSMPSMFFFKIYGGYLWILLLLYINPYTLRLSRLICSSFYPHREKQRILHLYNDILKKRMKMQKTLRRKAIQAARAHYLSSENLLSLRMKFPQILGWMRIIPVARMTCLICGETEPRDRENICNRWHNCSVPNCPFVFCDECWNETGGKCLACEPRLAELSNIDSLTDED